MEFALDQLQEWKLWSYTVRSVWWNAYIDAVTYSILGRWILRISRLRCFVAQRCYIFSILLWPGRFNAEHLLLKMVKGFAFLLKFITARYNRDSFGPSRFWKLFAIISAEFRASFPRKFSPPETVPCDTHCWILQNNRSCLMRVRVKFAINEREFLDEKWNALWLFTSRFYISRFSFLA